MVAQTSSPQKGAASKAQVLRALSSRTARFARWLRALSSRTARFARWFHPCDSAGDTRRRLGQPARTLILGGEGTR